MHFPVFRKGCMRVHEYVCGLLGIEPRQSLCVLGKYSTTEPGTLVLSGKGYIVARFRLAWTTK